MTEPTRPVRIVGAPSANGVGSDISVRRTAIHSLEVNAYGIPPSVYDADGNPITGWTTRYGVMARVSTDVRVRVADYAELADAEAHVRNDPDGLLG